MRDFDPALASRPGRLFASLCLGM